MGTSGVNRRRRSHRRRLTFARIWPIAALAVATVSLIAGIAIYLHQEAQTSARIAEIARQVEATPQPSVTPVYAPLIEMPPPGSTALFIGDSWVYGEVADPNMGFPYMLSARTGWVPVVDGHPGSGFTRSSRPEQGVLPDHVDALDPALNPAVVFLEGGINDVEEELDMPGLRDAMERSITTLQAKYPNAQIVVLAPFNRSWPMNERLRDVARQGENLASQHDVKFVNPIGRSPWINANNVGTVVVAGRGHPGNEGHQYLADKLYEAITEPRLVQE